MMINFFLTVASRNTPSVAQTEVANLEKLITKMGFTATRGFKIPLQKTAVYQVSLKANGTANVATFTKIKWSCNKITEIDGVLCTTPDELATYLSSKEAWARGTVYDNLKGLPNFLISMGFQKKFEHKEGRNIIPNIRITTRKPRIEDVVIKKGVKPLTTPRIVIEYKDSTYTIKNPISNEVDNAEGKFTVTYPTTQDLGEVVTTGNVKTTINLSLVKAIRLKTNERNDVTLVVKESKVVSKIEHMSDTDIISL